MTEKALRELLRDLSRADGPVKKFEIRSYGKSEPAMLYFPDAQTKKGALNSPPHAHRFTRREVELIVEYLCEP